MMPSVCDCRVTSVRAAGDPYFVFAGEQAAMDALAADDCPGRPWRALVQHRFGGTGALAGHAVGNLLLAGLIELLGDPAAADAEREGS